MAYDSSRHHRRSVRLRGYDYARPGAYLITIVTHRRECLFGNVVGGEVHLSAFGKVVRQEWVRTATVRSNVTIDEFVIMPNHVHGILVIAEDRRGMAAPCPYTGDAVRQFGKPVPDSVPTIVGQFKSIATRRINALRGTPGWPVWQRGYRDDIIREERELQAVRQYIAFNPARWQYDRER